MRNITTIRSILQESIPSTLRHYTSFESLTNILKVDASKGEEMCFWFSNPVQTNDPKELHFFTESLYKGSLRNHLKGHLEDAQSRIGHPFTLSLTHHIESPKTYPFSEIPLWGMYGNHFNGVRLRFKYKALKQYCEEHDDLDLVRCKYITQTEMDTKTRNIRKIIKNNKDNYSNDFDQIYKESVCYKGCGWLYENEWRLVHWYKGADQIGYKTDGRLYLPIKLPISLLDAVEVGPKADLSALKVALELIKKKYSSNGIIASFNIIESKLKIGYV